MPIIDDGHYYGWDPKTKRAQCGGYPDDKSREPLNKRIETKYGRIEGEDLDKALGYLAEKHYDKHAYHAPELNCRSLGGCRSCGSLRSVDIKPSKAPGHPSSRKSSHSSSVIGGPASKKPDEQSAVQKKTDEKKRASRSSSASSATSARPRNSSMSSNQSTSEKRSSVSSLVADATPGAKKSANQRSA